MVVAFKFAPVRLVFWRGVSYAPCLVTEKDNWFTNEFMERGPDRKTRGCSESMSDKRAHYSHVKISKTATRGRSCTGGTHPWASTTNSPSWTRSRVGRLVRNTTRFTPTAWRAQGRDVEQQLQGVARVVPVDSAATRRTAT